MLPTFPNEGNMMIEECISPRLSPPRLHRGDIITYQKPTERNVSVCKRILGLPGDTVCVDPRGLDPSSHVVVPAGHVWVQGDNSPYSTDSRTYGPVPIGLVKGKIVAVVRALRSCLWHVLTSPTLPGVSPTKAYPQRIDIYRLMPPVRLGYSCIDALFLP